MKKSIKIAVHYYTEITDNTQAAVLKQDCYVTNRGGKQYLVEIWR